MFVLCCAGSGLCKELITGSEGLYRVCVCLCVCVETQKLRDSKHIINYDLYTFVISNTHVHFLKQKKTSHSRQHLAVLLQYNINYFVLGTWKVKKKQLNCTSICS